MIKSPRALGDWSFLLWFPASVKDFFLSTSSSLGSLLSKSAISCLISLALLLVVSPFSTLILFCSNSLFNSAILYLVFSISTFSDSASGLDSGVVFVGFCSLTFAFSRTSLL